MHNPVFPQMGCKDIADDKDMQELFGQLDTLNAFVKLYEAWKSVNDENWHSKQLSNSLQQIFVYVNQLASYISMWHDDIDVQIEADLDYLKGKQFSTVVKRTDEWKSLKKFLKRDHNWPTQPITVQAICTCILKQTREFACKL
jgi:cob(I)alamin adenosyltransferase